MLCIYHAISDCDNPEKINFEATIYDYYNNVLNYGKFKNIKELAEWAHKKGCNKFLMEGCEKK